MSQQLEDTSIWLDIKQILDNTSVPQRFEYTGEVHTVTSDIPVMKIINFDIVCDYVNETGEIIWIDFAMPLGVYLRQLYPNRNNLEMTIFTQQLQAVGTNYASNTSPSSTRYKAVFSTENPTYTGAEYDLYTQMQLDLLDVVKVKLQLINRSMECLRIMTISGVYTNITMEQLMYGLIGGSAKRMLVDGKSSLDGLDVVKPNNTKTYDQIVLREGTQLTSLPTYLQEKSYGVYNGGIGTFICRWDNSNYCFIYPLFDQTRFSSDTKKLVIYSAPRLRTYGTDRTYRKDSNVVYVLATSSKNFVDSGEAEYMTHGVGFTMADANAMMKKPVTMTKDGPVGAQSNLNFNVSLKTRDDGLNFGPVADREVSANPFAQYSRILSREGAKIDFVWHNSNPDLIFPGMMGKFVFMENGKINEYQGTVLFKHTVVQSETQGIASNTHTVTTWITMHMWTDSGLQT